MKIKEHTIEQKYEDADGCITTRTTKETTAIQRNNEPDYIKIYTKMWCEFNDVPEAYRQLFFSLIVRMSYCNSHDQEMGQLVYTGVPWRDAIMQECGWTARDSLMKGLKALCNCGAIRKISRGVYQINPSYAGKGEWQYNPRLNRGGIEDLVAKFKFSEKEVEAEFVWSESKPKKDIDSITVRVKKEKKE